MTLATPTQRRQRPGLTPRVADRRFFAWLDKLTKLSADYHQAIQLRRTVELPKLQLPLRRYLLAINGSQLALEPFEVQCLLHIWRLFSWIKLPLLWRTDLFDPRELLFDAAAATRSTLLAATATIGSSPAELPPVMPDGMLRRLHHCQPGD